jgi:isopenicillin N synthase-like dioxygenase
VANPPGEAASVDRISLVFFQMPNHDARISCIESCIGGGAKYPATTYTDHYMDKLMKAAHARLDADTADAG